MKLFKNMIGRIRKRAAKGAKSGLLALVLASSPNCVDNTINNNVGPSSDPNNPFGNCSDLCGYIEECDGFYEGGSLDRCNEEWCNEHDLANSPNYEQCLANRCGRNMLEECIESFPSQQEVIPPNPYEGQPVPEEVQEECEHFCNNVKACRGIKSPAYGASWESVDVCVYECGVFRLIDNISFIECIDNQCTSSMVGRCTYLLPLYYHGVITI